MVTAALPVWNGKIVWLQLESLCRQETTVPWEIVMYECESKKGWDVLSTYSKRLKDAGCESVTYLHSEKRMRLGDKWRGIAKEARGDALMLCAADNYSPPNRVQRAHEVINEENYDWLDTSRGLFYDIKTGRQATWTRKSIKRTGLWMATRTEYIKSLSGTPPEKNIDGWIMDQMPKLIRWQQDGPQAGVHTDGMNTISHHRRGKYVTTITKPFVKAEQDVGEILPESVMNRLSGE